MINDPFYIVIHHSTTKDHVVHNNAEAIKRYHMSYAIDGVIVSKKVFMEKKTAGIGKYFKHPWNDIGYHFVIEKIDGEIVTKRGRNVDTVGAHAYQKMPNRSGNMVSVNAQSIGICIVGNYDKYELAIEYRQALVKQIAFLLVHNNIPINNVIGHREIRGVVKTCPGKLIDMGIFRDDLRKYMESLTK